MEQNNTSVSIPTELKQYQKVIDIMTSVDSNSSAAADFGVKLIKDANGHVSEAVYYSDTGDLIKKIFYKGSLVSHIEHYRYNRIRSQEQYKDGKMYRKSLYNKNGYLVSTICYEYNRAGNIVSVRKNINNQVYQVKYDYDELGRPNCRILCMNTRMLATQKFRYDIIDRIVEYEDNHQKIKVYKVNQNNELVKYTITDNYGNVIEVLNKFLCSQYIGTDVNLNGHIVTVKNSEYLDNVMLKKPYPSSDDLDLAMSNILGNGEKNIVEIVHNTEIGNGVMSKGHEAKILPISIRKLQLL